MEQPRKSQSKLIYFSNIFELFALLYGIVFVFADGRATTDDVHVWHVSNGVENCKLTKNNAHSNADVAAPAIERNTAVDTHAHTHTTHMTTTQSAAHDPY